MVRFHIISICVLAHVAKAVLRSDSVVDFLDVSHQVNQDQTVSFAVTVVQDSDRGKWFSFGFPFSFGMLDSDVFVCERDNKLNLYHIPAGTGKMSFDPQIMQEAIVVQYRETPILKCTDTNPQVPCGVCDMAEGTMTWTQSLQLRGAADNASPKSLKLNEDNNIIWAIGDKEIRSFHRVRGIDTIAIGSVSSDTTSINTVTVNSQGDVDDATAGTTDVIGLTTQENDIQAGVREGTVEPLILGPDKLKLEFVLTADQTQVDFDLQVMDKNAIGKWFGFGLSASGRMVPSDVFICSEVNGEQQLRRHWLNSGYSVTDTGTFVSICSLSTGTASWTQDVAGTGDEQR